MSDFSDDLGFSICNDYINDIYCQYLMSSLKAFLTLAKDIKAKMDRKQVNLYSAVIFGNFA